jgi:hypothetical protein
MNPQLFCRIKRWDSSVIERFCRIKPLAQTGKVPQGIGRGCGVGAGELLSCLLFCCHVLCFHVSSSCLFTSCLALSCLILSCLVLSCVVLSFHVFLSCLFISCLARSPRPLHIILTRTLNLTSTQDGQGS